MKNLILTTLSDSRWPDFSSRPEVSVFLSSAQKVPNTELVIIADTLNLPIPFLKCPASDFIILDRWLFFYRFLSANNYKNVLLIDSRDVYFQEDPFQYLEGKVLLSGEGVTHEKSTWNAEDQKMSQENRGISIPFSDWPVVNGGVVLGPASLVRDYCLLIYTNAQKSATKTDQADINRLWSTHLRHNPDFQLADPHTDTFCVTGETIKRNQMEAPVFFEDGKLLNAQKKPYALFHQWERTEFRDAILSRNRV